MEGGTIIPIRCNPRENRYNSRERGEKGEKFRRIHRKKIDIRRKDDGRGRGERGRSRRDKFLPIPQLQITRSLLKLNWNTVEGWGGGVNQGPANKFHVLSPVRREASYYPGGGSDRRSKRRPGRFLSADREGGAPVDGPRRPAN